MSEDTGYEFTEELSEEESKKLQEGIVEPEESEETGVYNPKMENVPSDLLLKARDKVFELNPMINKTQDMVNVVSHIVYYFYVENKRYVIIEAPTGSGKSVIGYLTYQISKYCINVLNGIDPTIIVKDVDGNDVEILNPDGEDFEFYYLTTSKVLQEQIEYDIKRFGFERYMGMLKGSANYLCTKETNEKGEPIFYNERFCIGFKKDELNSLPCFAKCPYKVQRQYVASKDVAVLNYAFFLNTTKSSFRPLFKIRDLTIADECHLAPEAVLNAFNYEFTQWLLNKVDKVIGNILYNFSEKLNHELVDELNNSKAKCFQFYSKSIQHISQVLNFYDDMILLMKNFHNLKVNVQLNYGKAFQELGLRKEAEKIIEKLEEFAIGKSKMMELSSRPLDIFFESEIVSTNTFTNTKIYKHVVKDLSESTLCREHFVDNTQKCLMMSATIGNAKEFANMMGLHEDEYKSIILNSNFDFSESPIYLCKSGYLNYNNYNQNIDKCLMDCIRIAENYHPKDKGIIHTSTNTNTQKLREKIMYNVPNINRYLFYSNSEEKEKCIEKMKSDSSIPYVIVGPSLYEGIDLKDDFGRFNILLKVPYQTLDNYSKQKSLRYDFWYKRVTKEKIVQAIGRTNRNKTDWSKTYLIDSCFESIIWECGTEKTIHGRIKYLTIR